VAQLPDGESAAVEIPGTADPALDLDPRLVLDPDGRSLTLSWSREVAGNLEVAIARFANGVWTEPVLLSSSAEDDELPQVSFVHSEIAVAVWMSVEDGVPTFHYRPFTRQLVPLGPAEPLVVEPILLDSGASDGPTAPIPRGSDHFLFLADFEGRKRLVLFGVRDEPAPIPGRWIRLDFVTPETSSGHDRHRSSWVDGSLLIRVETDQGLLYNQQTSESTWTGFRLLDGAERSMEAAELLVIEQMLTAKTVD
jgi:hypothetical protein